MHRSDEVQFVLWTLRVLGWSTLWLLAISYPNQGLLSLILYVLTTKSSYIPSALPVQSLP